MKSVAIIIPYFGKLNNYFSFWRKTALNNPSIDFLFFTDVPNNVCGISNIIVYKFTFDELRQLVQSLYDFPIQLKSPYKLCDLKPAYGEIFHDYIKSYDYWGHCDVDLFLGDIRRFITDDILQEYDRILSRGHLTLYRNTIEVNSRYKMCDNWKYVFSRQRNFAFDEWPGTSRYWKLYYSDKMYDEKIYGNPDSSKYHFVDYQWEQMGLNRSNLAYEYKDGKLFCHYLENDNLKKEEILYVHFEKRNLDIETNNLDSFYIIPNKIISKSQEIDVNFLKKHCGPHRIYMAYYKRRYNNLKRKLYNLFLGDLNKI